MSDYQAIWDSIPIRHDIISYLLGGGICIGFVLIMTILLRWQSSSSPTRILGIFVASVSLVILDLFLGYTGLMKYVLLINNFSESLVILAIPLLYLLIRNIVHKQTFIFNTDGKHLIIPFLYFIFQLPIYFRSSASRLNDYTQAYHSHLPFLESEIISASYHKPVTYIVGIFYCLLVGQMIWRKYKEEADWLLSMKTSKMRFVRNTLIITALFIALTIVIFTHYQQDLGDHIIGIALSYIIFSICYFLLNESRIFTPAWIADKYETMSFKSADPDLIQKASDYILEHDFHLKPTATLSQLSEALAVSPNLLSQKINGELKQNYNEYINQFRISESQKRLISDDYNHLSIEGIGQSVGFKSKSSFYTAFKKITSMTPSAYRKQYKA